jgi:hypothetical protein
MIIFVKNTTMEKTAIEFIVKELIKLGYLHSSDYSQSPNVTKVIEQAKEMEKQQIIDAYETAMETDIYNEPLKVGKQYYNQTYKQD